MSHIVTIQTKLRDALAIAAACSRLHLDPPVHDTVPLYQGPATGLVVRLRDWRYPVVVDTTTGTTRYDNYEGAWGDPARLNELLQAYAVEKTRIEAGRKGLTVREQSLSDGSIRLVVTEGV